MPEVPGPLLGLAALNSEARQAHSRRRPGVVHLGLGAFHRSHQAWFTQIAASGDDAWGLIAFTGRKPDAAEMLAAQDGVFTLIERSADGDTATLVDSVLAAYDSGDVGRWRAAVASPDTAVITLTVTEAGYRRGADGTIDSADPDVVADLALLRAHERSRADEHAGADEHTGADEYAAAACTTVAGRLVDGLRSRRDASAGPIAVLCCDNLTDNGAVVRGVVVSLAEAVSPELATWILGSVSFASSMVDRITPATTDDDRATARALTGFDDHAVVVAEPFAEWVVSGDFPAGRPPWEQAGVRFVDDLEPYEQRKLWLLNAGHSLLAYLGLLLGHETIEEAMRDETCTRALEQVWDEAAAVLPLPEAEIDEARASLRERFKNPRIRHRLAQIAADGSVKLPVRLGDPLGRRLAAGLPPGDGTATAIAAWWLHLRDQPELVSDPGARRLGDTPEVADVIELIAPGAAARSADAAGDLLAAVTEAAERIVRLASSPTPNEGVLS